MGGDTLYYQNYYQLKKHLYKERYEEQKRKAKVYKDIYAKYGGEKMYYKKRLEEFGFLKKELPVQSTADAIYNTGGIWVFWI